MNDDQQPVLAEDISNKTLPELARNISQISRVDTATGIVKAAFNAVPVFGGSIASLLDDFIPASREKRLREFAERVANDINTIQNLIDTDYVKSDEFAYLFTRVFQNVTRDYQQSKLNAYRNILVNSLKYNIDDSIKESYLKRVEDLTALHLDVLSCFHSDLRNQKILGDPRQYYGSFGDLGSTFRKLLPHLNGGHVESALFDLDTAGITSNVRNILNTMMTGHGALELEGRLTPYGREFVRFISQ